MQNLWNLSRNFFLRFLNNHTFVTHIVRTVNILGEVLMIAELSGGSLQHVLFKNTIIAQGLK